MEEQNFSNYKFGLWKKWFWVGIALAIINIIAGLVYGVALAIEKDHRKEGIIIIVVAIVWFIFAGFFLGPWLRNIGIIPNYQLLITK